MKIKISDATPLQLNWLAATLEVKGKKLAISFGHYTDDSICIHIVPTDPLLKGRRMVFAPSANWAQIGQIIEREKISVFEAGDFWGARPLQDGLNPTKDSYGSTPPIAVLRAYLASKLGHEQEVPDEIA